MTAPRPVAGVRAIDWPAGERLFRGDERWVGGDDAYSIPLGGERRLWLFGDTFIARRPGAGRSDAAFVHSSVAIQQGDDPTTARMRFRWREEGDGRVGSFLPGDPDGAYRWPGDGACIDGRLLLFAMRVRDRPPEDVDAELETLTFFDAFGWDAYLVEDPSGDPLGWDLRPVALPEMGGPRLVGSAGVLLDGEHLLAHAWEDGHAYLVRWERDRTRRGDLRAPQLWCGPGSGWCDAGDAVAVATLVDAETEFTVHRTDRGDYLHVQMAGLFRPRLDVRRAVRPEGPWSDPTTVYEPHLPDGAFAYAGKAHPGLGRDRLVATYNTIPLTVAAIRERPELYRPSMVRLSACGAGTR